MWNTLLKRFAWLDVNHPIALREARRTHPPLPTFVRKLSDPWTMLGYAAMLHGGLFVVSLLSYGSLNRAFPNMMLPFLTPFGTPLAAAMLQSILYWAMLIGVCHYTTSLIASDVDTNAWPLLRMTSHSTREILLTDLAIVGRIWFKVLRMLVLVRIVALVIIPMSVMVQRAGEDKTTVGLDTIGTVVFVAQPVVDALLIASLSALSALLTRGLMWAKATAYGLITLVYGGLAGIGGFWLIFKSPLGTLGGLLVPLNHWAPFFSALTPGASPAEYTARAIMLVAVYLVIPLLVVVAALFLSERLARAL